MTTQNNSSNNTNTQITQNNSSNVTQNQISIPFFHSIIERIGKIKLFHVYDEIKSEVSTVKKYALNIKNLISTIVTAITQFDIKSSRDIVVNDKISDMNASITQTVTLFSDFLNFNHSHVVELTKIEQDDKNTTLTTESIETTETTPILTSRGITYSSSIIGVMSSISMYFTGSNFSHNVDDFNKFKTECDTAYKLFDQLKSVDHSKIFEETPADVMNLIIIMCVIAVPTIDILKQRMALITTGTLDDTVHITSTDIKNAINGTYNVNLEFVLSLVTKISDSLIKVPINPEPTKKPSKSFIKRICCCC